MTGEPMTFHGVPVVFDETMETAEVKESYARMRFPCEEEADRLLPFAEAGFSVSGPQSWRIREAVRQVLIQLDKEKNGGS